MTRSDQFATVMDAVRAAFNDFSERRISLRERTRRLRAAVRAAEGLRQRDRSWVMGYISARVEAPDR